MREFFYIVLAIIFNSCNCLLSFQKNLYDKWYFIPLGVSFAICSNLTWFSAVKFLNDPKKIYIFSIMWDFVICVIYFLFPMIFCKINLQKYELIGLIIVLIGICIMKIHNN